MKLFALLQNYSVAVQAGSALLLLVAACIFLKAAYKIVHAPFRTYVRPVKVEKDTENGFEQKLTIRNFGPGMAVNVNVFTYELNNVAIYNYKDLSYKECRNTYEIREGEEAQFNFPDLGVYGSIFYIEWESLSGKKYKGPWLLKAGDGEYSVIPAGISVRVILKAKWVVERARKIHSMFVKLWDHIDTLTISQKQIDVLKLLESNEELSYDEISPNIKQRSEVTKKILYKMAKKEYIKFDGVYASITETGLQKLVYRANERKEKAHAAGEKTSK